VNQEGSAKGIDAGTAVLNAAAAVDLYWNDPAERLHRMPGTELLHSLDEALQADHPGTVSPEKLARSMRKAEIPEEIAAVLACHRVHLSQSKEHGSWVRVLPGAL
jgi:hypothetical protein